MTTQKHGNQYENRIFIWQHRGFHGDPGLMAKIHDLIRNHPIQNFIETGTETGSTLAYVARTYPHLHCYSCEADPRAYNFACNALSRHTNVSIFSGLSVDFLKWLPEEIMKQPSLYWLDAHSHGFGVGLLDELEYILSRITNGFIFIDDFEVPGDPTFGFDQYDNPADPDNPVKLSWDYIAETVRKASIRVDIQVDYPTYNALYQTRGWCMLTVGEGAKSGEEQ